MRRSQAKISDWRGASQARVESLEARCLLANVAVDLSQVVRPVNQDVLGTNVNWWQWELDTPQMRQMLLDAGMHLLRMPGGSSSNEFHFAEPERYGGFKTAPIIAKVIESAGADGMVSTNYGTGSPQEAAAFLAYLNANVGDTTAIGMGEQWDAATKSWVWKDWQTAGYWAGLRAASPLAVNDGWNHLRISHPTPFNFTYWEVGNENFATWEKNFHTSGGTAMASSEPVVGQGAAKAFDLDNATSWIGTYTAGATWLRYEFFNSEPQVVRRYSITSAADIASNPTRAPKSWTFQGSNDGSAWTTLNTQTNQAVTTNTTTRNYSFTNTTAYRYCRLNITAVNGGTQVQIGEVALTYDVVTYTNFAKEFSDLAHQIDPDAKVGVVVTLPMQWNLPNQNWTDDLLKTAAQIGFTPGFLSDHVYVGGLTDQNLLLHSVNEATFNDGYAPLNWSGRTQAYRSKLTTWLPSTGSGVEIMLTEFNSDLSSKQSTSLVNGLFLADAMGGALQTEYTSALFWDLTNAYNNMADDPSHYGWRTGNDDGMISTGSGPAPASGPYVPYPTYFAEQAFSKIAHAGDAVIRTTTDDPYLTAYAIRQANGHLGLLVINKSASSALTGNFSLAGFVPAATGQATFYQYGKSEDTAQSLTTDGHAALSTWSTSLPFAGSAFSYSFPSYSMTVIDLAPSPLTIASSRINDGSSQRSMITGITYVFSHAVSVLPSAFSLTRRDGQVVTLSLTNPLADGMTYLLSFTGGPLNGASLADGMYRLTLNAAGVSDLMGQTLSGVNPGMSFHRLFGDSDGDRDVDGTDLLAFKASMKGQYLWYFDYDGNSVVNGSDYQQLKSRLIRRRLV